MNEFEITVWSLYLDKLEWNMENLQLEIFLLVTSMQVKERLNDESEMGIYTKKVAEEFYGFKIVYDNWIRRINHSVNIELKEINKLYTIYRSVSFYLIS